VITKQRMISTKSFSELIRNEEMLLQQLLLVSERQIQLVEQGNATILLEHLGQRQKLWQEFEDLERQLAPHRETPPESRIWRNPEERQATELSFARCKALLEEIMANDQKSMDQAAVLRDEIDEKIRRIQRTGHAAPAYMKQSQLQR